VRVGFMIGAMIDHGCPKIRRTMKKKSVTFVLSHLCPRTFQRMNMGRVWGQHGMDTAILVVFRLAPPFTVSTLELATALAPSRDTTLLEFSPGHHLLHRIENGVRRPPRTLVLPRGRNACRASSPAPFPASSCSVFLVFFRPRRCARS
jgi:hypothetical protein